MGVKLISNKNILVFQLFMLLLCLPVQGVQAVPKEILLIDGSYGLKEKIMIPKTDREKMLKILRPYVYAEYGNRKDCYNSPLLRDDLIFLPGSFTRPYAKQYITAYIACDNGRPLASEEESGIVVFEGNKMLAAFKAIGMSSIAKPIDINGDGKDEFLILSGYVHMGENRSNFRIVEIYNNMISSLYSNVVYNDMYLNEAFDEKNFNKIYLLKDRKLKIKMDTYHRKITPAYRDSNLDFQLINSKIDIIDFGKMRTINSAREGIRAVEMAKLDFFNKFKPFYAIQLIAASDDWMYSNEKGFLDKLKKFKQPISQYKDENGLNHYLIGRFSSMRLATKGWASLNNLFPNDTILKSSSYPVIRFFNARKWVTTQRFKIRPTYVDKRRAVKVSSYYQANNDIRILLSDALTQIPLAHEVLIIEFSDGTKKSYVTD